METRQDRTHKSPLAAPRGDDRLLWDLHASEHFLLWLAAADELRLFAALDAAPASAEELAGTLQIGVVAAEGLLGVLAAFSFLVEYDHRFSLTQTSRDFLLPSSPYYRGPWLDEVRRRPRVTYDMVSAALRNSQRIHPRYWEHTHTESAQAEALVRGVHSLTFAGAAALAERGDFSQIHRLLDVGGGAGGMSIALALQYPGLECTVLDQRAACAVALENIAAYGLGGQVDSLSAEVLADPWPTGYDAVLLSHVLDCFDAQRCQMLIEKSFICLPQGGSLYIHEMLVNDAKDGPLGAMAVSLYDHLSTGDQQWTATEVKAMVVNAGFAEVTLTPTYGYNALISAAKP